MSGPESDGNMGPTDVARGGNCFSFELLGHGAPVVVWLTGLAGSSPCGRLAKSRYGLRYGFDAACTDFQGLTGPPASCKSLYLLHGAVLSRR